MTIKVNQPNIPVLAVGDVPLTPEQIVEQLRILKQHIPEFAPLTVADAALLRRAATVHDDLVRTATNTVGASPGLAGVIQLNADDMRNERMDVSRWSAVEDELGTMFKGAQSANLTRRHRLGLAVLQTYAIARQLVRKKEYAELLPHVAEMRRVSKFGRKRRPAEEPAVVVVPAPGPAKP
jgi:hypothetical protein